MARIDYSEWQNASDMSTPPFEPPVLELPPVKRISLPRQLRGSPFQKEGETCGCESGPGDALVKVLLAVSESSSSTPRPSPGTSPRPRSPAQRLLFAGGAESPPATLPPDPAFQVDDDDCEGAEFADSPTSLYAQFSMLRPMSDVTGELQEEEKEEEEKEEEEKKNVKK